MIFYVISNKIYEIVLYISIPLPSPWIPSWALAMDPKLKAKAKAKRKTKAKLKAKAKPQPKLKPKPASMLKI